MRIAFTGTSCTGKTTLALYLMSDPMLKSLVGEFLSADARGILERTGFRSMDRMTREELRAFQRAYFEAKLASEKGQESFVTDRSFVDVAAYWVCRDTFDQSRRMQLELEEPCRIAAGQYDMHVFFPWGLVPFEDDGYRSLDLALHLDIERQIRKYLSEWQLTYTELNVVDLKARAQVIRRLICGG